MGKGGVCLGQRLAENFFSHLKTEIYHCHTFATHQARANEPVAA